VCFPAGGRNQKREYRGEPQVEAEFVPNPARTRPPPARPVRMPGQSHPDRLNAAYRPATVTAIAASDP
jgi:hypothetical protein